jgi:DNA repair photolyase
MRENSGDYKLDKGRVVVSNGGICPLQCSYCYTYSQDFRSFPAKSADKLVDDLGTFANRIDIVQLGCDTEMFLRQNEAVRMIRGVANLDKDVSFATKMCLSDRTIDELASINNDMRQPKYHSLGTENYMVAFVSLTGIETAQKLEPKAPSPEKRIQTIQRLHNAGIPTYTYIKPLLPSTSREELARLFDATSDCCDGYVLGLLYADQDMLSRLGMDATEVQGKMSWGLDQRDWIIFEDQRVQGMVEQGKIFAHSIDAVDHVRQKNYQESITEGLQAIGPGTDFFESSIYSARLAVPENIRQITVMAREDNISSPLVLHSNVFTGEIFDTSLPDSPEACRKLSEYNSLVIDQPPNAYLALPRTLLLEDGRLFAHTGHLADFNVTEATIQSLLKSLESAVRSQGSFVSVCECLDENVIKTGLDLSTFAKVKKETTIR